jgi:site-specific recombinase XerD
VPVRTITQLRDRALFEFLLDTGCRISEVLGIDWTTIDLEKGEVKIMGKGSKQRTVFLNESKEWILEYLEHRGSDAKALFLSQYKVRPLNRGNAAVAIRELGKKAGIKQVVHPHLVRHTFGTYLIWAGVNPRTVQDMMGHSYLETTLRYYSAVTKEHMKQALFLMQFIEVLDEEYEMNFDAELKSFSDDFKMFQTKNPSVLTSDESNEN